MAAAAATGDVVKVEPNLVLTSLSALCISGTLAGVLCWAAGHRIKRAVDKLEYWGLGATARLLGPIETQPQHKRAASSPAATALRAAGAGLLLPHLLVYWFVADKVAYVLADNMGYSDTPIGWLHMLLCAAHVVLLLVLLLKDPGRVGDAPPAESARPVAAGRSAQRVCKRCMMVQPLRAWHVRTARVDGCIARFHTVSAWINGPVGAGNHVLFVALLGVWLGEMVLSFIVATLGIEAVWRHTTYNICCVDEFRYGHPANGAALVIAFVSAVYLALTLVDEARGILGNTTLLERRHASGMAQDPVELTTAPAGGIVWWQALLENSEFNPARGVSLGGRDRNLFDLGWRHNIAEFLGLRTRHGRSWAVDHLWELPARAHSVVPPYV